MTQTVKQDFERRYRIHLHAPDEHQNYYLVEFTPDGLTEVKSPDGEIKTVQAAPTVEVESQNGELIVRWRSRPWDAYIGLEEFEAEARRRVEEYRRR